MAGARPPAKACGQVPAGARGGAPTDLYTALEDLRQDFPLGTPIDETTATGPITALATSRVVLLVSHASVPLTVP